MTEKNELIWNENSCEIMNKCRIFNLCQVEKTSPLGNQRSFYILDAPDWVTVIPIITDKNGIDCFLSSFK